TLPVPIGTIVKDANGKQLADLDEAGLSFVAAQGGLGGLGNNALASQKRIAPGFALLGTPGWEGQLVLELKTVADVALVGYPSAGKSSLIAAVSQAKPKIADYPFTTLHPNLGVVEAGSTRFTVADVPGLIEGASEGRGLGLEFLRHVERCSVLVHVIDCATLEADRDPMTDFETIRKELAAYPVAEGMVPLLDRPQIVVLNKADVPDARDLAEMVKPSFEELGLVTFIVSAASHEGLRELNYKLAELVNNDRENRQIAQANKPRVVIRPKGHVAEYTVSEEQTADGPVYRIRGEKPERWVLQTDFANEEAVGYLADRLQRINIDKELFKAGAIAGATVYIGADNSMVFDWEPTLTSAAELIAGPRGTDSRFDIGGRKTRNERRQDYFDRMDAKAFAREELEEERKAGLWSAEESAEQSGYSKVNDTESEDDL
ncbi:MAG: GTPase ObgE, partial [Microbacteriaceae bacterium]